MRFGKFAASIALFVCTLINSGQTQSAAGKNGFEKTTGTESNFLMLKEKAEAGDAPSQSALAAHTSQVPVWHAIIVKPRAGTLPPRRRAHAMRNSCWGICMSTVLVFGRTTSRPQGNTGRQLLRAVRSPQIISPVCTTMGEECGKI